MRKDFASIFSIVYDDEYVAFTILVELIGFSEQLSLLNEESIISWIDFLHCCSDFGQYQLINDLILIQII